MRIIIFGGGGFLGRKLAAKLLERGSLSINGQASNRIGQLVLFDKFIPKGIADDPRLEVIEGDICEEKTLYALLDSKPDVIFHLAAIVSGEAEKNFDLGMDVNLTASWNMLEYIRGQGTNPVLVFASSCAVFGGDVTKPIQDDTASLPRSSYGTQKAMVDLLINDYSRRGFINGRALRLPTIVVRPGKPNAATTSFVSSIIREPLQGKPADCPVGMDTPLWVLSPKRVIDNFIHAAGLKDTDLGPNRLINLPGITVTVEDMVNSLESVGGKKATDLINFVQDDFIQGIVLTFPPFFVTERAEELGFQKDGSFKEIIEGFIEAELGV